MRMPFLTPPLQFEVGQNGHWAGVSVKTQSEAGLGWAGLVLVLVLVLVLQGVESRIIESLQCKKRPFSPSSPHRVAQWLALLPHSARDQGSIPGCVTVCVECEKHSSLNNNKFSRSQRF